MADSGVDVLDKHKDKEATTKVRELHMVEKNMSINQYALKIKGIIELLASINVSVDDISHSRYLLLSGKMFPTFRILCLC